MSEQEIVTRVADDVKARLEGEGSGHDWWHIYRVWSMAKRIAEREGANLFAVELAALLHDIADWKFHDGDDTVGPRVAGEILAAYAVPQNTIAAVAQIISEVSFKGAGVPTVPASLEGRVVQDADRLDALGAIGIARTFAYGGHKNRPMHDPDAAPVMHRTKEEYMRNQSTTVNHFYEKLLLLKDLMNTEAAKEIAKGRHAYMEEYLQRFFAEWKGEM